MRTHRTPHPGRRDAARFHLGSFRFVVLAALFAAGALGAPAANQAARNSERAPDGREPAYARIDSLLDEGWYDDAHAALDALQAQAGESPALLFRRGRLAFFEEDYEAAEELLDRAIDGRGAQAEYHLWRGHAAGMRATTGSMFKALGRGKRCKREYEQALAIDPRHRDALFSLLLYHLQAPGIAGGDRERAPELAERLRAADPATGRQAWYLIHAIADEDSARAEAALKEAIRLAPERLESHAMLARFYVEHGNPARAESIGVALLATGADTLQVPVRLQLAELYLSQERLDAALAQYEAALAHDPAAHVAHYQIAKTCILAERDLERARRELAHYLAVKRKGTWPPAAAAHWRLAQVHQLQGDTEAARLEVRRALALDPDLEPAQELERELRGGGLFD